MTESTKITGIEPSERYEQLWTGTWGDTQHHGPVHRRQREELLALVKKLGVRNVLDVGCGSGDNLLGLSQVVPQLVLSGVDVSAEALSLAAQRLPAADLRQLDVTREALNQRFDLVMAIQVVEHLADDVSALRNMALMARKWVLVATMRGRMRPSELKIGHLRNYSDRELRAKAETAGLEVVDIFGWGFPFYSPLYRTMIEWLPGGPPEGKFGATQKAAANFLYHLYGLNVPRCGDVVTMLARPRAGTP
jgi:2-polyprenyl-3-methyl-5-hydroxy-6-metoxy-1,4-benzoquinol methylase